MTSHTCKMAAAGAVPAPPEPHSFPVACAASLDRGAGHIALAADFGQLGVTASPAGACLLRLRVPRIGLTLAMTLRTSSRACSHLIQSACPSRSLIPAMRSPLRKASHWGTGPLVSGGLKKNPHSWGRGRASGPRPGDVAPAPSRPHDLAIPLSPPPPVPAAPSSLHLTAPQTHPLP